MKVILSLLCVMLAVSNALSQLRNNNANIVMTPGSYLVLNDMGFVNNGVFMQPSGVVKMMGENNSAISGTVRPQFYGLQIAKNAAKEVQLLTHVNVAGDVSFVSGLLNLNNRNIFLLG